MSLRPVVVLDKTIENARATFWWMRIVEFLGFEQVVQESL